MLGEPAARISGFHEALAFEDAGRPRAVLVWARMSETPSTVRAIVEMAHAAGAQGGRFDEIEIARACRPPAAQDGPTAVTLFARRRGGAIHYRLTGIPDAAPPPPTAAPLAADVAHRLVCGTSGDIVALGAGLLLGMLEPGKTLTAEGVAVVAAADWMPRASSPFYDFNDIKESVRRAVVDRILAQRGFAPPADGRQ